jgi:hypothetical protein
MSLLLSYINPDERRILEPRQKEEDEEKNDDEIKDMEDENEDETWRISTTINLNIYRLADIYVYYIIYL